MSEQKDTWHKIQGFFPSMFKVGNGVIALAITTSVPGGELQNNESLSLFAGEVAPCAKKTPLCVSCILIYSSIIFVVPIGFVTHFLGFCQYSKQKAIQIADSKITFTSRASLVLVISFSIALYHHSS